MGRKKDKRQEVEKRRQDRKKDMEIKKKLRQKMGKGDRFKLDKQYVDYALKFDKQIAVLRVKIRDVGGDGNCMFRAFADQVDGCEQAHKFMRQEACKYMNKNQQFFRPFLDEDQDGPFDKYIKSMQKDGQWGGHLQIQALCQCFKCIVVIHKIGLQQIIMRPMISQPTFGVIHLGYFQHEDFEHYVSIREKQDNSQLPAIQKLKFLNKNMYQHLLYQDEEEYMIQKQLQEMQIIEKLENQWDGGDYENKEVYIEEAEPFPGYPRNKKCKCGSKLPYKNCCYKEFQKKGQVNHTNDYFNNNIPLSNTQNPSNHVKLIYRIGEVKQKVYLIYNLPINILYPKVIYLINQSIDKKQAQYIFTLEQ